MTRRSARRFVAMVAWTAAAAGSLYAARAHARRHADGAGTPLAGFTEREVAVEIALEHDAGGHAVLAARFTPTRAGFHLYGKDLPRAGLQGIGRPTRLDVVGSAPRLSGALQADRITETLNVPLLGLSFPVYPAGPVTLRQPVDLSGGTPTAELSVTYMACSPRTCLAPAIDRRVKVQLPADAR